MPEKYRIEATWGRDARYMSRLHKFTHFESGNTPAEALAKVLASKPTWATETDLHLSIEVERES